MNRCYKVAVIKRPIGTAIEYQEPPVQGKLITKVFDSTTGGDYELIVLDADDGQHQANVALAGVEELSEEQAVDLAATYQPERTLTRINPRTMTEEQETVPACDLRKILDRSATGSGT
ncbi:MAG TPA: hypothetical protein VGD69_01780 [Herpetosiphonaceae bacterium]